MVTVMLGIGSANLGKLASVLVWECYMVKVAIQMRMAKIKRAKKTIWNC